MIDTLTTQVVCKKGFKRATNSDFFILAQRNGIAFIVLIDISTRCPFDIKTLQKLVSDHLHQEIDGQNENDKVSCEKLKLMVARLQKSVNQTFIRGSASLFVCAVKRSEIVGCVLGDIRLGQVIYSKQEIKNIRWLTHVHTAANPFGEFGESMKTLPERHILTRCLKAHRTHEPEVFQILTNPKDTFLVASDGFWCDIAIENYSLALQGMADMEDDYSALLLNADFITSKPLNISHPNIVLL